MLAMKMVKSWLGEHLLLIPIIIQYCFSTNNELGLIVECCGDCDARWLIMYYSLWLYTCVFAQLLEWHGHKLEGFLSGFSNRGANQHS